MIRAVAVTLATVLAVAASPAQILPRGTCTRTYTVQAHDYCDLISAKTGVSTYQLAAVNSVVINADCTNIWVGQVICLAEEGLDCSPVSVVQPAGDSCWSIATAAGISTDTLIANNPNVDSGCFNIYPGEVLCVAPAST